MSPKDKAKELVNDYYVLFSTTLENTISEYEAAKCALLAVKEITKQCWDYRDIDLEASYDYWNEVKKEIEKL
jgi:hypothetical protein